MISLSDYKNANNIKNLVQKLFEARQVAHNVHLQTKSYSCHKALNSFYDDLLGFTDKFIETYQGQYGIITGYEKIEINPVTEIEEYLEDCAKIFILGRDGMKNSNSHLKNILDEIVALTYQTLYKLKNLK
jgi:hypothetical protein